MTELDPKIIIREESNYYLLYNGKNLGLISLSKETFDKCIIHDKWGNKDSKLQTWLYENDFLTKKPNKKNRDTPQLEDDSSKSELTFYDIKSEYSPLNLLWALSPKCNLSCIYCFPDAKTHSHSLCDPTTHQLLKIANKIIDAKVLKVTITGGECLLLENIWDVIKELKNAGITVAILTNGTSISEETLNKIRENELFIGISLDGPNEKSNSITRGPFVFEKTIKTITKLIKNNIPTTAMVTVTKHNFSELTQIAKLLSDLGVPSITLQDLRPFGTKETYDQLRLTAIQEKELENTLDKLTKSFPNIFFNSSELRIFHKSNANGLIMQCPAGDNFSYIDFYGDFFPCTSLKAFKMGNLLDDHSISELWQNSESTKLLRNIKKMSIDQIPACQSCVNKSFCDGGCRGDALFYNNDLLGTPSRCPKELGNL
jgi:radical SAM protein with 4Fe4S-binding SPASM domain